MRALADQSKYEEGDDDDDELGGGKKDIKKMSNEQFINMLGGIEK